MNERVTSLQLILYIETGVFSTHKMNKKWRKQLFFNELVKKFAFIMSGVFYNSVISKI